MNSKKFNPINFRSLILVAALLFSFNRASAQAHTTVSSSNGYYVDITLDVVRIIAPNSCKWGYNFNTRISYSITFGGSNIPRELYTLQTTLACGSYNNFMSLPVRGGKGEKNTHSNPWNPNGDCATATASSLNCNTFSLVIEGPGISRQTISMSRATILPVDLIDFTAKAEALNVNINWSTASELNNSHFELERSTDGVNWTAISKVMASTEQSAVNNYSVTDKSAAAGLNFYRLKQVDLDGTTTIYNSILAVKNESAIQMSVYPNPATTQFTLSGENIETATIQIIDAMGKTADIQGEYNNGSIVYSTENLNNGIYFINLSLGNETKTYKITINK
jgi:hypothetical protein